MVHWTCLTRPGRAVGVFLDTAGVAMIGYARVSTSDQNPEVQATRLREQGYLWVFADRAVSGKLAGRPQWDACRAYLRAGDVLVVTKLDRIGRSAGNLIEVVGDLATRGVDLAVLDQSIDTSTPAGRMLFHVLAAIAEHDLIAERTRDGLAAARARHGGKLPPRGPSISPDKLAVACRPAAAAPEHDHWWAHRCLCDLRRTGVLLGTHHPGSSLMRAGRVRSMVITPAFSSTAATQPAVARLVNVFRCASRLPGVPCVE